MGLRSHPFAQTWLAMGLANLAAAILFFGAAWVESSLGTWELDLPIFAIFAGFGAFFVAGFAAQRRVLAILLSPVFGTVLALYQYFEYATGKSGEDWSPLIFVLFAFPACLSTILGVVAGLWMERRGSSHVPPSVDYKL